MAKPRTAEYIQKCRDEQTSRYEAYYQTVMMSVGLKHIFNEEEPCSFKINEPSMRTNNNVVTPDAIFQCDKDTKGIVAEIKTTLPDQENQLLSDMKDQIEKYSEIEEGWKTNSKRVDDHSILLLIDRINSKRLDDSLKKWLSEKKIVTNRKICLAEWQSLRNYKPGMKDVTLINHRTGSTGCEYFDKKLMDEITIPTDDLGTEYEERKFVRTRPPDLYLMTELYTNVFPALHDGNKEFEITIDQIWQVMADYYTSWSGLAGEQSQIRRGWLNSAMEKFCEIDIAEKVPEKDYTYKIKWKSIPKDVKGYFLDKLCGKELPVDAKKKQTEIDEFSS